MSDNTEATNTEQPAPVEAVKTSTWFINLYRHPTMQMATLEESRARRLNVTTGITVAIRVDNDNNIVDIIKAEDF